MCQQYKTEASITKHSILFISLDTHKTFTEVAYILGQHGTKPIHLGKIPSNKAAFWDGCPLSFSYMQFNYLMNL